MAAIFWLHFYSVRGSGDSAAIFTYVSGRNPSLQKGTNPTLGSVGGFGVIKSSVAAKLKELACFRYVLAPSADGVSANAFS